MTDETVHLLPARPDVTVRDPISREALPPQGAAKPLNTYWSRRLVDQDVMVAPGGPAATSSNDD